MLLNPSNFKTSLLLQLKIFEFLAQNILLGNTFQYFVEIHSHILFSLISLTCANLSM